MRLYEGTIAEFSNDVTNNRLADCIKQNFTSHYHKNPNESEYRAWQQSLNILNNSFLSSSLVENKIIVEFELPYSSRRIDVLLFGTGADGKDNVVLVELKQWSNKYVEDCETEGNIVVDYGSRRSEEAHPSLQVQGYHFDLKDFFAVFEEQKIVELSSLAYCHNYARQASENVLFYPKFTKLIKNYPVFAKEDVAELGVYLRERLSKGPGLEIFNRFITSPVRPSRRLLDHTSDMINQRQIFNLIDDQIAAYNAIMHRVKGLAKFQSKSIVIVKGGPGTGKSVIALEVMGELMRQGKVVCHATGSSAFTNTLRKIVGRRARNLFGFFFSFTKHQDNEIDVLICDEAHRIRTDSNDYGVPGKYRSRNPQVIDLIRPAKLTIFFIDEWQVVRPKEVGSIDLIREAATKLGVSGNNIAEFELTTQFRCSGSDVYLQWLDRVLGVRDSEIAVFDNKMEFRIFEDPRQLKSAIAMRNQEKSNSARLVAGFCWPWSEPRADGSLVNDVKVGSLEMPWEKKDKFWEWATHESGMEQVGTVYTAQGFEFDYIGVIFGNDLVFSEQDAAWVSRPENSCDSTLKRNNMNLTRHLKSVYRVLMSRAHKGVYVYFMDKETEKHFREQLTLGKAGIENEPSDAKQIEKLIESVFLSEDEIQEERKYSEYLPVYSIEVAASAFREGQHAEIIGWKRLSISPRLTKEHFIAKVVGKSMEPTIPDGSYCVFRKERGGSRNGLIVLVESKRISDPESGQGYTVKRYHSEKELFADGTWRHKRIVLSPDNKVFEEIVLEAILPEEFRVVAEFICCL